MINKSIFSKLLILNLLTFSFLFLGSVVQATEGDTDEDVEVVDDETENEAETDGKSYLDAEAFAESYKKTTMDNVINDYLNASLEYEAQVNAHLSATLAAMTTRTLTPEELTMLKDVRIHVDGINEDIATYTAMEKTAEQANKVGELSAWNQSKLTLWTSINANIPASIEEHSGLDGTMAEYFKECNNVADETERQACVDRGNNILAREQ